MNHVPHILITLFSCGLWAIVWIVAAAAYNARFHCSQCGFSDATRYLANPYLRQQEAQRPTFRSESAPASAGSPVAWFSGLSGSQKVIAICLAIFSGFTLLAALSIAGSKIDKNDRQNNKGINANTNSVSPYTSSSNSKIASATPLANAPTVPPAPEATDLDSPDGKAHIVNGTKIYSRIAGRTGLPVMFGWRAASMSLLIPIGDWNALSKSDQVDLSYYAENLVREIRANPAPYARRWSEYYKRTEHLERGGEFDGLYESAYIEQVGNLCNSCWDITIGKAKRDGFYDEDVPVKGATVQEFRQANQKQVSKTVEEKQADDFKQFYASMTPSGHLEEARTALDANYDPSHERFGNTVLARKHIKAIPRNAPEFAEAQKLLQQVVNREKERKEFSDAVIKEVNRLAGN